jgi:hypothetical protein
VQRGDAVLGRARVGARHRRAAQRGGQLLREGGVGIQQRLRCPARARWPAIGAPITPMPMNPIERAALVVMRGSGG